MVRLACSEALFGAACADSCCAAHYHYVVSDSHLVLPCGCCAALHNAAYIFPEPSAAGDVPTRRFLAGVRAYSVARCCLRAGHQHTRQPALSHVTV
jgi:hypothetical protein